MTTMARDVMTSDVEVAREDDSVLDVAKKLARTDLGAVPVCGTDDRLKGMLTDRDIVVRVLAEGRDPAQTTAAELGQGDGQTVTIGADDSVEQIVRTMADAGVRRLPVIDGDRVIGIVSLADLATDGMSEQAAAATSDISSQPPNN